MLLPGDAPPQYRILSPLLETHQAVSRKMLGCLHLMCPIFQIRNKIDGIFLFVHGGEKVILGRSMLF